MLFYIFFCVFRYRLFFFLTCSSRWTLKSTFIIHKGFTFQSVFRLETSKIFKSFMIWLNSLNIIVTGRIFILTRNWDYLNFFLFFSVQTGVLRGLFTNRVADQSGSWLILIWQLPDQSDTCLISIWRLTDQSGRAWFSDIEISYSLTCGNIKLYK